MIALLLALQAQGWTAAPYQPTVGDTIQLERSVAAPPGWRLRAGKLTATSDAEPLGDAAVLATSSPGAWILRYTVVAWTPVHGARSVLVGSSNYEDGSTNGASVRMRATSAPTAR